MSQQKVPKTPDLADVEPGSDADATRSSNKRKRNLAGRMQLRCHKAANPVRQDRRSRSVTPAKRQRQAHQESGTIRTKPSMKVSLPATQAPNTDALQLLR